MTEIITEKMKFVNIRLVIKKILYLCRDRPSYIIPSCLLDQFDCRNVWKIQRVLLKNNNITIIKLKFYIFKL